MIKSRKEYKGTWFVNETLKGQGREIDLKNLTKWTDLGLKKKLERFDIFRGSFNSISKNVYSLR
jgi:hypothetical protein